MHRSTSPSSKSPSPTRKDRGTMERPLPVYSDFSHMSGAGGVGTVKFVVGLREDNPDAIIARVFPLTKIVPGEVKEKKVKPKPKKVVVEDKTCQRADCAARKEKLANMKDENKGLRMKVKAMEGRVDTVRNKIALNEKSIILAEEKNDTLNGQIEESQTKIVTMTADVEKAENFNRALRSQLERLQEEIQSIQAQTEDQTRQLQELLEDKTERKIVFSRDPRHRNPQLANEVSVLHFNKDIEYDSD